MSVSIPIADELGEEMRYYIDNPTQTVAKIRDLEPSTIYIISVQALTSAGAGDSDMLEDKTKAAMRKTFPSFH